jgi:hypothetical protein
VPLHGQGEIWRSAAVDKTKVLLLMCLAFFKLYQLTISL